MRVKRYVADTIPEAIAQVKSDLGRNAIILHTKPFKEGGFLGFFSKRRFEVIAAIDENAADYESTRSDKKHESSLQPFSPASGGGSNMGSPLNPSRIKTPGVPKGVASPTSSVLTAAAPRIAAGKELAAGAEPELNNLKEELAEVKELIKQVVAAKSESQPPAPVETPAFVPLAPKLVSGNREKWLKQYNFEDELVGHLIETANYCNIPLENQTAFMEHCRQTLSQSLVCRELILPEQTGEPQVVTLIGPTGVGKTTTIAKLAANFNLFEGRTVGLITIDTYRIAAVEHLKTYGEIINLPVEVVYNQADLQSALEKLKAYDLILIDTAGRSPHNQAMMEELRLFLNNPVLRQIQLVISATTQYRDMIGIVENFAVVPYSHFIFTKLDETSCLGPVISLAWKTGRPISYLTTGQNVPDDIELAKAEKIVNRLFKEIQNG